jgi:large subunit ribosomal protein L9
MKVILRQDVEKVGLRGEVVEVARGFARNFLLPRRLAEPATPSRVAEIEKVNSHRSRHEAQDFEQAQEISQRLGQTELRFDVKAGDTGVLFGSVTATDIADRLWDEHKIRVDRRKIELGDAIKRIGRYEIPIELFADVVVAVRTLVVPEGGELPPELEEEPVAPEPEAAAPAEGEEAAAPELSDEELEAAIAAAEQPEAPEPIEEPSDEAPSDASDEPPAEVSRDGN